MPLIQFEPPKEHFLCCMSVSAAQQACLVTPPKPIRPWRSGIRVLACASYSTCALSYFFLHVLCTTKQNFPFTVKLIYLSGWQLCPVWWKKHLTLPAIILQFPLRLFQASNGNDPWSVWNSDPSRSSNNNWAPNAEGNQTGRNAPEPWSSGTHSHPQAYQGPGTKHLHPKATKDKKWHLQSLFFETVLILY